MGIPRYTQVLASLVDSANNIFITNPWDYVKNVVGRVNPRCQFLGIPNYTHARKHAQGYQGSGPSTET
jgi:hypothetical protein